MTSLFSSANEKMDRNAEDRFTWRLFLCVMQFLLAERAVQAFLYPHPVISRALLCNVLDCFLHLSCGNESDSRWTSVHSTG